MKQDGIHLDRAELISVVLEAILYGFSLLMFGTTIWTLVFRRSTDQVNREMVAVACLLLLGSTTHLVIDIIRTIEGFITYRGTYLGGPVGFFANVSHWTFVSKDFVFAIQTLIGDGVILYRCYVVWQSKPIMILPVLLWCSTAVTGILSPYTASRVAQNEVFGGSLSQWITAFWATALSTNLLTTLLLVVRIWYIDRKAKTLRSGKSHLRPVIHTIIDAGAIYSFTLFVALVCFVSQSNAQYVILDMVTPIISITFYMVIIRVGLTARNRTTIVSLGNVTMDHGLDADQRGRTQVHITKLTETFECPAVEYRRSPARNEIKSDGVGEIDAA